MHTAQMIFELDILNENINFAETYIIRKGFYEKS